MIGRRTRITDIPVGVFFRAVKAHRWRPWTIRRKPGTGPRGCRRQNEQLFATIIRSSSVIGGIIRSDSEGSTSDAMVLVVSLTLRSPVRLDDATGSVLLRRTRKVSQATIIWKFRQAGVDEEAQIVQFSAIRGNGEVSVCGAATESNRTLRSGNNCQPLGVI